MKRIVWTFGLISGGILAAMMLITLPFESLYSSVSEIVGYTTMVLSFLLVYFGVRSYRDNIGGGVVSFGRALAVGLSIVAIASLCYVATWELVYYKLSPDFGRKFESAAVAKARASGGDPAEIDRRVAEAERFLKLYRNPLVNSAITFLEPLPVGVVIALVSAGVLRRKRTDGSAVLAASTAA